MEDRASLKLRGFLKHGDSQVGDDLPKRPSAFDPKPSGCCLPFALMLQQQGLWHILNLMVLGGGTKSSQVAHGSHPMSFQKLVWGLPARLHTCSSLPSHVSPGAVSSLTWGGHAPVFFSQASKCVDGTSQISPSDVCSVPPSQVTGSRPTSEVEKSPCGWQGWPLFTPVCSRLKPKRYTMCIKYNHCLEVAYCHFGGSVPYWRRFLWHACCGIGTSLPFGWEAGGIAIWQLSVRP